MSDKTLRRLIFSVVATLALVLLGIVLAGGAFAATSPGWTVKGQDNATGEVDGYPVTGFAAEAVQLGSVEPQIDNLMCGVYQGVVYGQSDNTECPADGSGTLVFENYWKFVAAINAGAFAPNPGGMTQAIYDVEPWTFTPDYQWQDPTTYITRAVNYANARNIKLIITPGGAWSKSTSMAHCSACWKAAVDAGAYMVSVQTQGAAPAGTTWDDEVKSAVQTIRSYKAAAGSSTLIQLGLATNVPQGVHPAWLLQREYDYGHGILNVSWWWLNGNPWEDLSKCRAVDGWQGCPVEAVHFWQKEGLSPASP